MGFFHWFPSENRGSTGEFNCYVDYTAVRRHPKHPNRRFFAPTHTHSQSVHVCLGTTKSCGTPFRGGEIYTYIRAKKPPRLSRYIIRGVEARVARESSVSKLSCSVSPASPSPYYLFGNVLFERRSVLIPRHDLICVQRLAPPLPPPMCGCPVHCRRAVL